MTLEQLNLLHHATELLKNQQTELEPFSWPTSMVVTRLNISASTLNRAKNSRKLPYVVQYEGEDVLIDLSHSERGKDYWKVLRKKKEVKL